MSVPAPFYFFVSFPSDVARLRLGPRKRHEEGSGNQNKSPRVNPGSIRRTCSTTSLQTVLCSWNGPSGLCLWSYDNVLNAEDILHTVPLDGRHIGWYL